MVYRIISIIAIGVVVLTGCGEFVLENDEYAYFKRGTRTVYVYKSNCGDFLKLPPGWDGDYEDARRQVGIELNPDLAEGFTIDDRHVYWYGDIVVPDACPSE